MLRPTIAMAPPMTDAAPASTEIRATTPQDLGPPPAGGRREPAQARRDRRTGPRRRRAGSRRARRPQGHDGGSHEGHPYPPRLPREDRGHRAGLPRRPDRRRADHEADEDRDERDAPQDRRKVGQPHLRPVEVGRRIGLLARRTPPRRSPGPTAPKPSWARHPRRTRVGPALRPRQLGLVGALATGRRRSRRRATMPSSATTASTFTSRRERARSHSEETSPITETPALTAPPPDRRA